MTIDTTEDKRIVADWISGHDDMIAEIEHLLDRAYPDGAEDIFYKHWDDILDKEKDNDWGFADNQYV